MENDDLDLSIQINTRSAISLLLILCFYITDAVTSAMSILITSPPIFFELETIKKGERQS